MNIDKRMKWNERIEKDKIQKKYTEWSFQGLNLNLPFLINCVNVMHREEVYI